MGWSSLSACSSESTNQAAGGSGGSGGSTAGGTGGMGGSTAGAGGGGGGSSDSGAPRCDGAAPFGTPALVDFGQVNVFQARLTEDELDAYLGVSQGSQYLQFASRASTSDGFNTAVDVAGLPAGDNANPALFVDGSGSYLLFQNRPLTSGIYDLWSAAVSKGTIATATKLPGVNSDDPTVNDQAPWVGASGTLYFARDDGGDAEPLTRPRDIFFAPREGSKWGAPSKVPGIEGPAIESNPVVPADELTIYFASNEADPDAGTKQFDIYVATRSNAGKSFDSPVPLNELNSPYSDVPTWVSADGCVFYFSSNRSGETRIYRAQKPKAL